MMANYAAMENMLLEQLTTEQFEEINGKLITMVMEMFETADINEDAELNKEEYELLVENKETMSAFMNLLKETVMKAFSQFRTDL
jgi:hypothetical protein